jgi:hypothetical protein
MDEAVDLGSIQLADLLDNYDHPAWPKILEAYRALGLEAWTEWAASPEGKAESGASACK